MLEFYAIYYLLDGNKSVCCGAMRGLAKQGIATVISGLSYYVISLPWQYLFAFYLHREVTGLWQGQMCAAVFNISAISYYVYFKFDWNLIGIEAYDRIHKETIVMKQNEMALI